MAGTQSTGILPSRAPDENSYNEVRLIKDQSQDVCRTDLLELRRLYIEHKACENFGVSLLHRHLELSPEQAMVYSRPIPGQEICTPEPFGTSIYPSSFRLDSQDTFIPFEYSQSVQTAPDDIFLRELADILVKMGLKDRLALSCVVNSELPWVEYPRGEQRGTIARQCARKDMPLHGIPTVWAFKDGEGTDQIVVQRTCVELKGGGHIVRD